MKISAKADYAVRAAIVLAGRHGQGPTKIDEIARRGAIPGKFLESILVQLKRAGLLTSKRGMDGGYALALPATAISVADILRAVDGPLAQVAGRSPDDVGYPPDLSAVGRLWDDAAERYSDLLEATTLDRLTQAVPVLDFQI